MATSPPITVGELTDVPAPNSPVNAQFHQEVAHRIIHRFTTTAAMNAWGAGNGAMAFDVQTNKYYLRRNGAWVALVFEGSPSSVTTAVIADGAITTAKIADGQVTGAKIADGTITQADLAPSVLSGDFFDINAIGLPNSNWSNIAGWLKRTGPLVQFHMQATKNGSGTALWGTVPDPYKPIYRHWFVGGYYSGNAAWNWYAEPDGNLWTVNTVNVPVGHQFSFDGTWRCA